MFENFVYFNNVVKLSQVIYHRLRNVSKDNIYMIIKKEDSNSLKDVEDLIEIDHINKILSILHVSLSAFHFNYVKNYILKSNELLSIKSKLLVLVFLCCNFNDVDFLKYLVENELVDINAEYIPYLCTRDNLEPIKYLIEKFKPDHTTLNESLFQAANFDCRSIVKYLMEEYENLNLFVAEIYASISCRIGMIELIRKYRLGIPKFDFDGYLQLDQLN